MSARRVLVFGGTGSIGLAICRRLAADGDELVVADLGDRGHLISDLPGEGHTFASCDVGDLESVRAVAAACTDITAVVSAVGINYTGPVAETDWSMYERMQRVNLQGAFHIAAACEESCSPDAYVFLASVAGLTGEAGGAVYCSTKFGLIGFVQSFAAEIAARGARANTVCPGNVDSPLLRDLAAAVAEREGTSAEAMLDRFAGDSAFRRLITVDEVAEAVAFLASRRSSGISGQSLVVDGAPN
ncbi:SDR family oxidoreductase [Microbacterium esteraromaticum]|uniref:SDR family oxidoreductase n=1 Tax=Microbacterium esteraromaticum TaxID=57043 RepID=A0A7D8AK14_9MICO|nr:SDR family oxidoreductase [Microbacterium esteraromaticum]QMU96008.1 SDR family oxidoreductase [Microbacterium esteraromaticum]